MSLHSLSNQTIALAAIAQACRLVHDLATTGSADTAAQTASIGSILKVDAESVPEVYGGISGIKYGLQQLELQLSGKVLQRAEQARYAAQLVYLQKQLAKRADLTQKISAGVIKAQGQAEHFGLMHANVQAGLADLYQNTISTISPRIMVIGDQQYLSNQSTANRIRSILLAGIRAAMLWRQCGGSRWKLLLFRQSILAETRRLLEQL